MTRTWFAIVLLCVAAGHAAEQPASGALDAGAPGGRERVLVIPFDNPEYEARLSWIGEASAVLLADNLNALEHRAFTREERLEVFERLQVPSVAMLSHATVIRLGQLVGATHVVIGSLKLHGDDMTVRAQAIRLDAGTLENEVVESDALDDLFAILERVSRRLISPPAAGAALARLPSLPAFESYIKGLLVSAVPAKVGYLQAALKLDPGFDRARLALWAVHHDQGNAQVALVAAAAVPETSPSYARARFSVALSLIQLKRFDDAFATLKVLADRVPTATVMNNIGVIQMRRVAPAQTARATYYFDQAATLDRDDPDYYFNLGYGFWAEKDEASAVVWLREAVRRNPTDGEAHAVLGAALQATGAAAEATRERELASQLSSSYADWAKGPSGGELVPRGLERLKTTLESSSLERVDSAIATTELREQRELAAFHLDRGRRFFEQGSDTEAATELRRALYLSPYEAEAHLLLGRIYVRTGQTPAAVGSFKISLWSQESAAAHLALAQAYVQLKDTAGARAEAQKALAFAPDSAEARALWDTLKP